MSISEQQAIPEESPSEDAGPVDVRSGTLQVRLAVDEAELEAAQALRYRVFYDERAARATPEMRAVARDFDDFDPHCDHLMVIDHGLGAGPECVVGTYRLMRRPGAEAKGEWYSAGEYDISALVAWPGEIMELGRSCIAASHRNKASMTLLWRGIAQYVLHHQIALMFGCASLHGTDPEQLARPLSYLHHNHLAPPDIRPRALERLYVPMDRLAVDALDARRALAELPPLIKGYLRLNGFVGDGAVVDHQFNTTDVCVLVQTDQVTDKYYRHYTRGA